MPGKGGGGGGEITVECPGLKLNCYELTIWLVHLKMGENDISLISFYDAQLKN